MIALPAAAARLTVLSAHDVALYTAAFDAAGRGDSVTANADLDLVNDPCLTGEVRYLELTGDGARSASYQQLSDWLKSFGDTPDAAQVYQMALARRPADAPPPPPVTLAVDADAPSAAPAGPSHPSHAAREAYFSGEVSQALSLARSDGDAWIAGLAAYRLGQYADAMVSFASLAENPDESDASRAAGGVWAARSAQAAGLAERVTPFLKIAAAEPETFYGMIAARELQLADDPLGQLIDAATHGRQPQVARLAASYRLGPPDKALEALVRTDPRAHRAAALAQLSRAGDAVMELRAGVAAAPDAVSRALWMKLKDELAPRQQNLAIELSANVPLYSAHAVYPTPDLSPAGGFTVEKALVYAVAWQESRFNSLAVSRVGAMGMMQLMPTSAASVAGDPTLSSDPVSLFDEGKNLALGQAYLNWLEAHAADYDILRTVAAYNAGPAALARTEALLGPGADSLMVIESMPAAETRNYVKKVMAAYWSYRRQFGAPTRTLDAVAQGDRTIDARLDSMPSTPLQDPQTSASTAREALEILLHHDG